MVIGELGEATIPGRTVATIKTDDGQWFQFNIREYQLRGIDIGRAVTPDRGLRREKNSGENLGTAALGRLCDMARGPRHRRP
jgi:hypothetical protein